MSQTKGKNTKPEMLVRTFLHAHGFRYRLHVKELPGKPSMIFYISGSHGWAAINGRGRQSDYEDKIVAIT